MKCACAPLTGPCEHLIAEWRKKTPGEGPFARIREIEAENAKLRAALAEIGCKYPQAVSREEAADLAVEFHSIARAALSCADKKEDE